MSLGISINKNTCIQSSILRGLKEGGLSHSASTSLFSAVLKTGLLILMLHIASACYIKKAVGTSGQRSLITASQPGSVLAVVCLGGDLRRGGVAAWVRGSMGQAQPTAWE